ncbi:MAG: hypothetical protein GY937_09805 [bacterium]|nr:hypothetical protein [bacterium]
MVRVVAERESALPGDEVGRIVYDESRWPLVEVRWPPDPSAADLESHLHRLQGYLDQDRSFKLLYDVSLARPINSLERKQFIDFFSRNREALQQRCRAVAYVTRRAVHRGILTAIGWFIALPFPLETFATCEQGLAWLGEVPQHVDPPPSTRS